MNNKAWSQFPFFFLPFFVVGLLFRAFTEKGTLVLWFTEHRTPLLDDVFYGLTLLGDGWSLVLVCIAAVLIRYKYALLLLSIGLGQLLMTWLLKRQLFGNVPRPRRFFADVDPCWFVEGVKAHSNYAFPSGHTITAFGLCFFCALMFDRKPVTIGCVLLAVLIGLSRIYLFQHFLDDVLAGSLVGIFVTAFLFYVAANWEAFWNNQKLERSVLGTLNIGR